MALEKDREDQTDRVINEESRRKKSYILLTEGRLTGLVPFSVGNAFQTTLLKTEGMIEMTGRRGRRLKQLLDSLTKTRGYRILIRSRSVENSLWTCRETTKFMNE